MNPQASSQTSIANFITEEGTSAGFPTDISCAEGSLGEVMKNHFLLVEEPLELNEEIVISDDFYLLQPEGPSIKLK